MTDTTKRDEKTTLLNDKFIWKPDFIQWDTKKKKASKKTKTSKKVTS